jgi:hypothetical protein
MIRNAGHQMDGVNLFRPNDLLHIVELQFETELPSRPAQPFGIGITERHRLHIWMAQIDRCKLGPKAETNDGNAYLVSIHESYPSSVGLNRVR